MNRPSPSSEDTGLSRPPNCIAGSSVAMSVKKIAATWLRVTVEATRPRPVVHSENSSAPSASVAKLPLIGTPNTVTASALSSRKFSIDSTT